MSKHSPRTIDNYIVWRIVQEYVHLLPVEFQEPSEKFTEMMLGVTARPARWEQCVETVTHHLPMIVGSMYVRRYFEADDKIEINKVMEALRQAFVERLEKVTWMDEATRTKALGKAYKMRSKFGYPDRIYDEAWLARRWMGLDIRTDRYFDNVIKLRQRFHSNELMRVYEENDRDRWFESPALVDAYYVPSNNEVAFPAGILQFPFFARTVPAFINFAMIGAVIGHEITHGYDDEGSQYDEEGNLNVWWDSYTFGHFQEKAKCLEDQYSNIIVPEIGTNLNGKSTLGENIADNGGMKTAYQAYRMWVDERFRKSPEEKLPGMENFTAQQSFFIAYANNWCSMLRAQMYRIYVAGDVHAPPRYRALVPLQNSDEFSEAFQCPHGSYMNPLKKCTIW